jgi:hypothetical protein
MRWSDFEHRHLNVGDISLAVTSGGQGHRSSSCMVSRKRTSAGTPSHHDWPSDSQ